MIQWLNSHKVLSIVIILGLLSGLLMMIFHPAHPHRFSDATFQVVKGWWPGWEAFQLGVLEKEESQGLHQTEFIQTDDYQKAVEIFAKDETDAATLTIFEALILASQGVDFKIVLLIDYTTGSDGLVAHQHINHIRELLGKRIGVVKGTISHFTVLKAMEKAGLTSDDVILAEYDDESLLQAFTDKKVDAIGTYEPVMSKIVGSSNGKIIFSSSEIPRAICDVLLVKGSLIRNKSGVLSHWIKSWAMALNEFNLNQDRFFFKVGTLGKTEKSLIESSFKGMFLTDFRENIVAIGHKSQPGYLFHSLEQMNRFMVEQKVIPKPVNISELIYFDSVKLMPVSGGEH